MKLVRQQAVPLSADTGLLDLRDILESKTLSLNGNTHHSGTLESVSF